MAREAPEFFPSGPIELRSSVEARTQLSSLYGVLVLAALMFDGRDSDSMLALAANAVSSLGALHTEATYRIANGKLVTVVIPTGSSIAEWTLSSRRT